MPVWHTNFSQTISFLIILKNSQIIRWKNSKINLHLFFFKKKQDFLEKVNDKSLMFFSKPWITNVNMKIFSILTLRKVSRLFLIFKKMSFFHFEFFLLYLIIFWFLKKLKFFIKPWMKMYTYKITLNRLHPLVRSNSPVCVCITSLSGSDDWRHIRKRWAWESSSLSV